MTTTQLVLVGGRDSRPIQWYTPTAVPKGITVSADGNVWTSSRSHSAGCRDAQRAISFYRQGYKRSREAMLLPGPVPRVWYHDCAVVARRAGEWRDRAGQARERYVAWHAHHYGWRTWLSRHWYLVGSCETGYGGPPNWAHKNSEFEGAFGFRDSSWDGYVDEAPAEDGPYPADADQATPRQQLNVALVIYGHFGMSGWGCKGNGG